MRAKTQGAARIPGSPPPGHELPFLTSPKGKSPGVPPAGSHTSKGPARGRWGRVGRSREGRAQDKQRTRTNQGPHSAEPVGQAAPGQGPTTGGKQAATPPAGRHGQPGGRDRRERGKGGAKRRPFPSGWGARQAPSRPGWIQSTRFLCVALTTKYSQKNRFCEAVGEGPSVRRHRGPARRAPISSQKRLLLRIGKSCFALFPYFALSAK